MSDPLSMWLSTKSDTDNEVNIWKCDCGQQFPSRSLLNQHRKSSSCTKTAEKPVFKCKLCNKVYLSRSGLQAHTCKVKELSDMEISSSDSGKKKFFCPQEGCTAMPNGYAHKSSLRKHIHEAHKDKVEDYINTQFTTTTNTEKGKVNSILTYLKWSIENEHLSSEADQQLLQDVLQDNVNNREEVEEEEVLSLESSAKESQQQSRSEYWTQFFERWSRTSFEPPTKNLRVEREETEKREKEEVTDVVVEINKMSESEVEENEKKEQSDSSDDEWDIEVDEEVYEVQPELSDKDFKAFQQTLRKH